MTGNLPGGSGSVRHVAVAISEAGVFLGTTAEDGPRVFHGRVSGSHIEWSAPWRVPVPPPKAHVQHRASWADYGDDLDGLHLVIDRLDPMRIAINRLEFQGGSYGLVVGRWNETFVEVAYPDSESDIRFGMPMVLRGSELFTHDCSSFWQFHLGGTNVDAHDLPLGDTVDELGWHAAFDETSRAVVLSAFGDIVTLKRTGSGGFELDRRIAMPAPIAGLATSPDGHAIVALEREDGLDLLTYDREWRQVRQQRITSAELDGDPQPRRPKNLTMSRDGARVLIETTHAFFVLDVSSGRRVRLPAPPSNERDLALAIHGGQVVLASCEGIALYSVTDAL